MVLRLHVSEGLTAAVRPLRISVPCMRQPERGRTLTAQWMYRVPDTSRQVRGMLVTTLRPGEGPARRWRPSSLWRPWRPWRPLPR